MERDNKQLTAAHDAAVKERDGYKLYATRRLRDNERLTVARKAAVEKRDTAVEQRDGAIRERDAAVEKYGEWQRYAESLVAGRDQAVTARDQAVADRDEWKRKAELPSPAAVPPAIVNPRVRETREAMGAAR